MPVWHTEPVWVTEAQLKLRHTRVDDLADRDGDGVADDGVIDAAITDAQSRVRNVLTRYRDSDFPTDNADTTPTLLRLTAAMAWVYLNQGKYDVMGADAQRVRAETLAELEAINSGNASLGLEDEPVVDQGASGPVSSRRASTLSEQPMTLESMESWGR